MSILSTSQCTGEIIFVPVKDSKRFYLVPGPSLGASFPSSDDYIPSSVDITRLDACDGFTMVYAE